MSSSNSTWLRMFSASSESRNSTRDLAHESTGCFDFHRAAPNSEAPAGWLARSRGSRVVCWFVAALGALTFSACGDNGPSISSACDVSVGALEAGVVVGANPTPSGSLASCRSRTEWIAAAQLHQPLADWCSSPKNKIFTFMAKTMNGKPNFADETGNWGSGTTYTGSDSCPAW